MHCLNSRSNFGCLACASHSRAMGENFSSVMPECVVNSGFENGLLAQSQQRLEIELKKSFEWLSRLNRCHLSLRVLLRGRSGRRPVPATAARTRVSRHCQRSRGAPRAARNLRFLALLHARQVLRICDLAVPSFHVASSCWAVISLLLPLNSPSRPRGYSSQLFLSLMRAVPKLPRMRTRPPRPART